MAGNERDNAVDKTLQKFLRAFVGDIAMLVDQALFERDIDFTAEEKGTEASAEHLAQMRLRQCRTERAGRRARNGDRLAGPVVLTPRPRAPIDAFLSTVGIERLCSGVTIRTPSARANSSLKRTTSAVRFPSWSWLNIGRSSMRT